MPKRLQSVPVRTHPAYTNLSLLVVEGDRTKDNYWYMRVGFGNQKYSLRSLKIPYNQEADNYAEAEAAALPVYFELTKRFEQGFSITRKSFVTVCEDFIKSVSAMVEENEAAIRANSLPYHRTYGNKAHWRERHLDQIRYVIDEIIVPYFDAGDYQHKPIESIQGRDISKWQTWRVSVRAKELSKDWAASTLNKQHRVLRQIFQYAKKEQLIEVIPDIQDVPENNREARRPSITASQYNKLLKHFRDKYENENQPTLQRIYQRLAYLWIVTIDATGIRPFKDEKNALKWEHIHRNLNDDGSVKSILISRTEKGKTYEALADAHWSAIYDDLKQIHTMWEMDSEYVFAHPLTVEARKIYKNEPIKNFRGQWRRAMESLGYAAKGAKQQDRISPYSIRHRYISRRMLINKDIRIEELAQIVGSSPRMLFDIYWHFDSERKYEDLVAGGYEQNLERVRLYDSYGILMDTATRDSPKHRDWYTRFPTNNEKPNE